MIKILESQFLKSAVQVNDFPEPEYPEIAFMGRSNVGKSSLINTILNRKSIAKTSSTPGKTRLINFFQIGFRTEEKDNSSVMYFVDLPGYGYAKVSKNEREKWRIMIENYFFKRDNLQGVILLIDIRRKADIKDLMMINLLTTTNTHFLIAATKSDKIPKTKIQSTIKKLSSEFGIDQKNILPFSAIKKTGKNGILNWIGKCVTSNNRLC